MQLWKLCPRVYVISCTLCSYQIESKTWTQFLTANLGYFAARLLPNYASLPAVTSGSHCSFSFMLWWSFFLKPLRFCPQFSGCPPLLKFPPPCRQFRLILSCTIPSVGLTAKCASSSLDLALLSVSSRFHLEFFRTSGGSAGTSNSIFHYRPVLLS